MPLSSLASKAGTFRSTGNPPMKLLLTLLLLSVAAFGQQTKLLPDCVLNVIIASPSGNSAEFDNRSIGCNNWQMTWQTWGASAASTLTFQQAPSNVTNTGSGTFVTFSGTPIQGSNPSTAIAGNLTIQGFAPWVRIRGTGITGTIQGQLLGCRLPCSLPGSAGGVGSSVTVTNFPNPQNVSGSVSITNAQVCAQDATTVLSIDQQPLGVGALEIIALSGSTRIYVCGFTASWNTSAQFSIVSGTGSNCGTGQVVLATYINAISVGLDVPFRTLAGRALCLKTDTSINVGGQIVYVQQ
jgi:hypothetical protein